ncbi:MAG: YdeI/OmpD-associated family protein [Gemmatimonadaceae bacterium]|nr:YdeI/OmpD-associated family protein [Gemmatimonadaceae bacterium]
MAAPETPQFFATAAAFRDWLNAHGSTTPALIVGFHKVGSGTPSLTWPESVDEALCVGWIDGVRKRIDDLAYQIRFTPRRKGSIWSTVNIARVEALTAEGRMMPAGLAAFALRTDRKSNVYAYEQAAARELTAAELSAFKRRKKAWTWFEAVAPSYRKLMLHWVTSAKQPATRQRRLTKLMDSCAAGERILR